MFSCAENVSISEEISLKQEKLTDAFLILHKNKNRARKLSKAG